MDLLSYVRILRRRWRLLLATMLVGAALGTGTALVGSGDIDAEAGFYKATHVLYLDTFTSSGDRTALGANLQQDALLVTSGDVPQRVGAKLGENGQQLAEQVLTTPNSTTSTLDITAAATTARGSEEIASTFAEELLTSLEDKEQARYEEDRTRVLRRLDDLQAQIGTLDAQLAGDLGNAILGAQRNGLIDQYRVTYQQFQALAEAGEPEIALSTLEAATAVPIGRAEYYQRLSLGRLGQNIVDTTSGSTDPVEANASSPSSTFQGPRSRGVLGAFLGLLAGIGLALVAERLDQRIRSRDEIEEAYGVPVLAEVPMLNLSQQHEDEVVSFTSPLSRTAETHRAIRAALLFQDLTKGLTTTGGNGQGLTPTDRHGAGPRSDEREGGEPLVVLVTSATANEGKTTTAANLAAVFAEAGASVLAVNCDFRRPTLHRYLGAPDEARRTLATAIPGVMLVSRVLTDPEANPAQIIAAQRKVIEAARGHFDVVLLDTAPLLATNDAIELMGAVDAALVVARPGVTTSHGAGRARELLERVHAPIVGAVLVGEVSAPDDPYYYYSAKTPESGEPSPLPSSP